MYIEAQTTIKRPKEQIWQVVSDLENATKVFKDIKSIEVLHNPGTDIKGFKWKEVREFMGKEAEETMWITEATENQTYTSEAINSGCIYHSGIKLEESGAGVIVTKFFQSTPQTFFAKLMTPLMLLMKGTLRKCIVKDLEDLKQYIEKG